MAEGLGETKAHDRLDQKARQNTLTHAPKPKINKKDMSGCTFVASTPEGSGRRPRPGCDQVCVSRPLPGSRGLRRSHFAGLAFAGHLSVPGWPGCGLAPCRQ
jgi:hypothetical protein